ncbi:hypothetical protein BP5796_03742 [Coleophoma crateriformis]|uniref:Azaphilone pigments biosynthesis cluster protein L N-terminal domain-containing protein n=1 Tax=Coleophoma crateriformis TaxID=565419 RepID=A0A3D8SGE1_9HELO|nr:hypothetical protein BP5796_03742 [Coleophoma crateriformis]
MPEPAPCHRNPNPILKTKNELPTQRSLELVRVLYVEESCRADLQGHLEDNNLKLDALSLQGPKITTGNATERQRMLEERESTQYCLEVCVSITDDGHQGIVFTVGDLTSARRVKAGARSMQVMG